MRFAELLVLCGVLVWLSHTLRQGGRFDVAWLTLFVGLGLMLSRVGFFLGALLSCVSLGMLTLPLARLEWSRLHGQSPRDPSRRS
ncbi:MAG: hypothetical protein R3F56_06305 [Planctomycetota bacterium]